MPSKFPFRFRTAMAFGFLMMAAPLVVASDDLLDPSAIGAGKKPKPAAPLTATSTAPAPPATAAAPASPTYLSEHAPSYARDMAQSCVGTLDALGQAIDALLLAEEKLDKQIKELSAKILKLEADKIAEMEDYRKGLFCSGCGKTKTYIDAHEGPGHFPHDGQHIIKPTPEQIAAKDRELQAPIDAARRERDAAQKEYNDTVARRNEGLAQFEQGVALWRNSIVFEGKILDRDKALRRTRFEAGIAVLDAKINAATHASVRERADAADPAKLAALDGERKLAHVDRALLVKKDGEDFARYKTNTAELSKNMEDEGTTIRTIVRRGQIHRHLQVAMLAVHDAPTHNGGEYYHMGDFDPKKKGEQLPRVTQFLRDFNATPVHGQPIPTPGSAMDKTKGFVKDLMLDDDKEKKPPADPPVKGKGAATGVRG